MKLRRRTTPPPAPARPMADVGAQLEEVYRQARLADQARFDRIGLPRYVAAQKG